MISQELPTRSTLPHDAAAKLAFLYEHPQWFAQVFAELSRRDTRGVAAGGPAELLGIMVSVIVVLIVIVSSVQIGGGRLARRLNRWL